MIDKESHIEECQVYRYEDNLFLRYAKRNEKIHVKCQNFACKSVETMSGETFVLNKTHSDHGDIKTY